MRSGHPRARAGRRDGGAGARGGEWSAGGHRRRAQRSRSRAGRKQRHRRGTVELRFGDRRLSAARAFAVNRSRRLRAWLAADRRRDRDGRRGRSTHHAPRARRPASRTMALATMTSQRGQVLLFVALVLPLSFLGAPAVKLRAKATARLTLGYESPSSFLPFSVSTL